MKFLSFAALALTCFLTNVSAKIELAAPSNPVSGGRSTVTWTHDSSDPAQFILMLQLASDSWATGQFWYFVETRLDKLDVTFLNTDPYVISTKSIYRLTARNQSNIDQILARSPNFRFLPPGSSATTTQINTTTRPTTTTVTTKQSSTTIIKTEAHTTVTNSSATASSITTARTIKQTTTSPAVQQTTVSLPVQQTTPPPAVQQTTTSETPEPETSTVGGEETGGVLGSNTNAAEVLSFSGGAVGAVVAVLAVGLASFVQF